MIRYLVFHKIIETGSFTKAAEALGYTQAAVSQMMRALESELKLSLFVRMRTGIRLTPEGEALYPIVRKLVAADRELNEKAKELCGLASGEIRVGTCPAVAREFLPSVLRRFADAYPGVRFVLRQGDSPTVCQMIRDGRVDFGLVTAEEVHGLTLRELTCASYAAVLPASDDRNPWGKGEISLNELAAEPLIVLEDGEKNPVEEAFADAGAEPNWRCRVQDAGTALSMVREGFGIALLPSSVLCHGEEGLCVLSVHPPIQCSVAIAYPEDDLLPVAAKRLIEYLCMWGEE
ncbi:MAG: LysR family transcriptional regulator [Eubacteriales bacterium]